MKKVFIFTICLLAFPFIALAWMNPIQISGGVEGCNYDLCEGFEGSGIPAGWAEAEAGSSTIGWDDTSAPIVGSESVKGISVAGVTASAYYDLGSSTTEIYSFSRLNITALTSAADITLLQWATTGNASVCKVGGDGSGDWIATHGSKTTTGAAISASTVYCVWMHCKRSTGSDGVNEIWIATEAGGACTKPGSPTLQITDGDDGDTAIQRHKLEVQNTNTQLWDDVIIDTAAIGSQ